MAIKYIQAQPFTLAGSGTSIGDSSVVIQSLVGIDGALLTMTDFGTKGWMTLEPGSSDREEQISFTGVTQNANGTATLTGVSTVAFKSPYTETANVAKTHPGGAIAVISNTAGFYNTLANKNNDETITGKYTFPNDGNTPLLGGSYVAPTLSNQVASKGYVDSVAVAGAPNASETVKGIIELATNAEMGAGTSTGGTGARLVPPNDQLVKTSSGASDENKIPVLDATGTLANGFIDKARTWSTVQSFTAANAQITTDASASNDAVRKSLLDSTVAAAVPAGAVLGTSGEAINAGQPVYVKASDGRLYKSVTTADESTFSFVGISLSTVAGAALSMSFAPPGHVVTGLAGLVAGSYYFLTGTAGTLGTTPGARFARVAQALSTTSLRVLQPKYIVSGSVTISATGNTTITTGFYPAKITINAAPTSSNNSRATSIGDDANACASTYQGGTFSSWNGSFAWSFYLDGSNGNQGTVSAKSSTGFTLNAAQANGTLSSAVIGWVAFSE